MLIKRFPVFPVEEGRDAHNLFLLVDNGQGQDVLDDKARVIHSLFLKEMKIRGSKHARVNSCKVVATHAYGACWASPRLGGWSPMAAHMKAVKANTVNV